MNNEEYMKKALDQIGKNQAIAPGDVPDIPLYMDQVLTLMDRYFPQENKEHAFTKTMINNYVKSGLLPPPDKKKYSPEHIYKLFIIYYMKSILKIDEISTVLKPAANQTAARKKNSDILTYYKELWQVAGKHMDDFTKSLEAAREEADASFADEKNESRRSDLQFSLFISLLSLDAWLRKTAAETMISEYHQQKLEEEKTKSGRGAKPRSK
ncbi:MAG: DUF1836 domain-containing protein [Lachnospiraceae bacterium]|jgi:hypothetical protein